MKLFKGVISHRTTAIESIKEGDSENNFQFTLEFNSYCLANSLIASLNGWKIPAKEILLGPNRSCE